MTAACQDRRLQAHTHTHTHTRYVLGVYAGEQLRASVERIDPATAAEQQKLRFQPTVQSV